MFDYLSKLAFFKRTLIRKNEKNKEISKEWNSKENFEFRKNVIRSNDLVPNKKLSHCFNGDNYCKTKQVRIIKIAAQKTTLCNNC